MTTLQEVRQASTPPPLFSEEAGTERGTAGTQRILTTNTEHPAPPGISIYTTRTGNKLFDFIVGHLDEEERAWFDEDIAKAVVQACQTHSFEPLGRALADWEETVEIKLKPELSRALDEAFDEADSARAAQGR